MDYKDYVKVMCPYCKNREENKCNIVKDINGICKCMDYELDREKLLENYTEKAYRTWTIKER